MAYDGEFMNVCQVRMFDFTHTHAVVVTGARWNPCGHMLLNTGGPEGMYFHIAERRDKPRYMAGGALYRQYLTENDKREIRRTPIPIKNPEAAHRKLEWLLSQTWGWWGIAHNCATFVEQVVQAGGSDAGLYFNCPTAESFK